MILEIFYTSMFLFSFWLTKGISTWTSMELKLALQFWIILCCCTAVSALKSDKCANEPSGNAGLKINSKFLDNLLTVFGTLCVPLWVPSNVQPDSPTSTLPFSVTMSKDYVTRTQLKDQLAIQEKLSKECISLLKISYKSFLESFVRNENQCLYAHMFYQLQHCSCCTCSQWKDPLM